MGNASFYIIYKFLAFFILQLSSTYLLAQETITITNQQRLHILGDKVLVLINDEDSLTIEDVLNEEFQQKFKPNPSGELLTLPMESTVWLKFIIEDKIDEDIWIDLTNGLPMEFDMYTFNLKGAVHQVVKSGLRRPKENKYNFSNHYIIPLNSFITTNSQTFYVRINTLLPIVYKPRIGAESEILPNARKYEVRYLLYLGLMLVMILYNSFIGFSTKDRVYLYYIIYLVYIAFVVPLQLGDYLYFHSAKFFEFTPVIGLIGYLIPTLFAFRLLEIKKNAYRFYLVIGSLTLLLVSISILYLFGIFNFTTYLNYISVLSLFYNPLLWSVGIYLWYKGYKNARFYTIAWTTALGVSLLNFMVILGLFPNEEYLINIFYSGFAAEVVLFGLALGDRINILKNENINLIQRHSEILEKKVTERTKQLQEAKDEISSQNEEITQLNEDLAKKIVESTQILIRQNEKLKDYAYMNAHQVRGPLARILGLTIILELEEVEPQIKEYLEKLNLSAHELDVIVKKMNKMLEESSFFEDNDIFE